MQTAVGLLVGQSTTLVRTEKSYSCFPDATDFGDPLTFTFVPL